MGQLRGPDHLKHHNWTVKAERDIINKSVSGPNPDSVNRFRFLLRLQDGAFSTLFTLKGTDAGGKVLVQGPAAAALVGNVGWSMCPQPMLVGGGAGATELQQSLGGRPPAQTAMPQVRLQNPAISEP